MKAIQASKRIDVNGVVQGVGFRPFVYQLAIRLGLRGEVSNTSNGVVIYLEGPSSNIESFLLELDQRPPPLAYITDLKIGDENSASYADFCISPSQKNDARSTLISPDMAICDDCLRELFDENDRRFQYPFINCTNCGPRYTIIEDIPYDRPKTSMKHFRMCRRCRSEYDNPLDRRFHAQPNACPACGPQIMLCDRRREKIAGDSPVRKAAQLLLDGRILAVKGLGGFHLAADAGNADAVTALRERKHREEKPLALMALDMEMVRRFAHANDEDEKLLKSSRRPIVILEKKKNGLICGQASPRNKNFGVMLPYTPLHYLILSKVGKPLVMTSGNISEEPICFENEDAFERLGEIADYFLIHDRKIYLRSDDSIVRNMAGKPRFFRRSRGYTPMPLFLRKKYARVLSCGAELKNTVCLTKGEKAFFSQHIGDLENMETFEFFRTTIEHMKRIIDIEPELIGCDLHPDYMSTRFALEQKELPVIQIQHHHAHIVSCLAENQKPGPVIGLAFDGAGFGVDGAVWGGEVLIADEGSFQRAAHPAYVAMPGAASAIIEPQRMALSYLFHVYGEDYANLEIPFVRNGDAKKMGIFSEMIRKNINSPLTSSIGRLFDGVAAMIGIRNRVAFEGQAAMELEMAAEWPASRSYDFSWNDESPRVISLEPIVRGIVEDLLRGSTAGEISGKFHLTLIRLFSKLCRQIRNDAGINIVALSGGSFQNNILLSGLNQELMNSGFETLTHRSAPCNDGGIALGQAVSAAAVFEAGKKNFM